MWRRVGVLILLAGCAQGVPEFEVDAACRVADGSAESDSPGALWRLDSTVRSLANAADVSEDRFLEAMQDRCPDGVAWYLAEFDRDGPTFNDIAETIPLPDDN